MSQQKETSAFSICVGSLTFGIGLGIALLGYFEGFSNITPQPEGLTWWVLVVAAVVFMFGGLAVVISELVPAQQSPPTKPNSTLSLILTLIGLAGLSGCSPASESLFSEAARTGKKSSQHPPDPESEYPRLVWIDGLILEQRHRHAPWRYDGTTVHAGLIHADDPALRYLVVTRKRKPDGTAWEYRPHSRDWVEVDRQAVPEPFPSFVAKSKYHNSLVLCYWMPVQE